MSKLYFCNCKYCKKGRKSKWHQIRIKQAVGGHRKRTKELLKKGNYAKIENKVSIAYTD